jgi:predicted deacylase
MMNEAMSATPTQEVLPKDLEPYRQGNTGIDFVHRFNSGKPGPHVLINALTHGNEFCGMSALTHLLDQNLRPACGVLTLSFANVEAYQSFDANQPFESRQLVHNFNRIWDSSWLDGAAQSPELLRARQMRSVFDEADHLLDIHSTSGEVDPFWVYHGFERNGVVARSVGLPNLHMVMPRGLGSGTPIIQYQDFGREASHRTGLVVECGQHFLRATSDVALAVVMRYLAHFGLLTASPEASSPALQRSFELLQTLMVKTPAFRFTGAYKGFERFARGDLIATDGDEEIRAPCNDCTIMMPARVPTVGKEAVYLTRPYTTVGTPAPSMPKITPLI